MAKQLALAGHTIYFPARTAEKASLTKSEIIEYSGRADIHSFTADLGSQEAIHKFVQALRQETDEIDVLIHNAGVFYDHFEKTTDGFEMTFAVNHLAGFIITAGLLDLIKRSQYGRIIFNSSDMHFRIHSIDPEKFSTKKKFNGTDTYATTKLCNVLFTYMLAEKLKDTSVTVNAFHPGVVRTDFVSKHTSLLISGGWQFVKLNGISVEKGAETGIYLADSQEVINKTGLYWEKKKSKASSPLSYDKNLQEILWQFSENACGINLS